MLVELLPNVLPPLMVVAMVEFAHAIALEATLSFLGIGLPITEPSLGLLISNGYQLLLSGEYWVSVYPGLLLLVLVFSINIVGDRLREVLNPRLSDRTSVVSGTSVSVRFDLGGRLLIKQHTYILPT